MSVLPQKASDQQQIEKAYIQYIPSYVSELRQKTGYYLGYIPNEYADQPTQANYYETLRKDPEIARCNNLMSLLASGDRLTVLTSDVGLTKILARALGEIKCFLQARKSLLEKSTLFGLGISLKKYRQTMWKELPGMSWWVTEEIVEVDRRRLRIERDRDNKNKQRWSIWHPLYDSYMIIEDRDEVPCAHLAIQDYIWLINEQEELFPYFEGLGEVLYMLAYIKSKVIQYWADLCESWAKPFLVVAIDLLKSTFNANIGSGFVSATKRVQDLIDTFEKTRSRHIAVIDKSDELQYHERGSSGANLLKELIEYCDKRIQFLFFGTELATQAGNYGSYKLGLVHKQETDTIIGYHKRRLEESLQRDLLWDFCWRNRYNLHLLGIELPRPCEILVEIKTDSNLKDIIETKDLNM